MADETEAEQDSGEVMADEDGQLQAPPVIEHFTEAERTARGWAARAEVPRASHSMLGELPDRDPVGWLDEQSASRVPELVPIRYGRMLVSPFTFYRASPRRRARSYST